MESLRRRRRCLRITLAVGFVGIAALAAVLIISPSNARRWLHHSDMTSDQMRANFTVWLVDHTYDYVSIDKVVCAASHPGDGTGQQEAQCRFTSTLSPATPYPRDNGLGLTGSGMPAFLHSMPCEIALDAAEEIQSVRCPTVIGWIFRSSRQSNRL